MPAFICKKVSKPKVTISETPHKFLNHTFYYPGRAEWDTVSLTLADPVNPDAAGEMLGMLMLSGYKYPSDYNASVSTISKSKSVGGLGEVRIEQLGAGAESLTDRDPIESWTLINAWVKEVNFGELDYDSEDMVNIDVVLRYDYAVFGAANSPQSSAADSEGAAAGAGGVFGAASDAFGGAADAAEALDNAAGAIGDLF